MEIKSPSMRDEAMDVDDVQGKRKKIGTQEKTPNNQCRPSKPLDFGWSTRTTDVKLDTEGKGTM